MSSRPGAVDVLRDDRGKLAGTLQLGQLEVGLVGLGAKGNHARAVEVVELGGMRDVEVVGEHLLGRVLEVLMVQTVLATKVRDARRRRNAGAPEEDDALGLVDGAAQLRGGLRRIRYHSTHSLLPSWRAGMRPSGQV